MPPKDSDTAASPSDHTKALTLIHDSVVMTLAVATVDGPWAAPVYYVYRPVDKGFYFFSAPDSRHVSASKEAGGCGAAIFRQAKVQEADAWRQICGLQMRGRLAKAGLQEGAAALPRYLEKFPLTRTLLPAGKESLTAFGHHFGVRLYRFQADLIEWTDNRVRFGYRRRLVL